MANLLASVVIVATSLVFGWQCTRVQAQQAELKPAVEYLNQVSGSKLPFSDAVRVGDLLILSGKIGVDASGKLVPGGIQAETKQTMENIRSALEAYGSSLDNVVKCTVMLADMKEWQAMNDVYITYFKQGRLPARSALGANGLALNSRVEIECWAVVRKPAQNNLQSQVSVDQIVITQHEIKVNGKSLRYTAHAGQLPIIDNETGAVHGHVFFTAYLLDTGANQTPRPLTFLWNGGPGSSSSLVHLLGFGPRRLQSDGTTIDNEGTWLNFTDLVFVDPVGTGYSRPAKPEYGVEFYQTRGDAESIAEFIRVYRNRFEAWNAPLFIGGESYGVTRAANVADVLQRRGIKVHGAILMGLDMPLGEMTSSMRTALMLPTYAAAAFANKKLAPELQGDLKTTLKLATDWARNEYADALEQREKLNDAERQRVLAQLSKFTGLEQQQLDQKTLRVSMDHFAQQLLADRKQVLGHYDSRLIGPSNPNEKVYDPTRDPSLKNIINDVSVVRYFRNELHYLNDLQYQGPFGGGYPPATAFRGDWMSVRWNRNTAGGDSGSNSRTAGSVGGHQPLQRAMTANPQLRVLIASGVYDLVCSYAANEYLADKFNGAGTPRISVHAYKGGHAIYTDLDAQREMKRDVEKFIQNAISLK